MTPNVRLDMVVEGMRHQVTTLLTEYELDLSKQIREGVEQATLAGDLEFRVRNMARKTAETEIEAAVERAVKTAIWDPAVRDAIKQASTDAVLRAVRNEEA